MASRVRRSLLLKWWCGRRFFVSLSRRNDTKPALRGWDAGEGVERWRNNRPSMMHRWFWANLAVSAFIDGQVGGSDNDAADCEADSPRRGYQSFPHSMAIEYGEAEINWLQMDQQWAVRASCCALSISMRTNCSLIERWFMKCVGYASERCKIKRKSVSVFIRLFSFVMPVPTPRTWSGCYSICCFIECRSIFCDGFLSSNFHIE